MSNVPSQMDYHGPFRFPTFESAWDFGKKYFRGRGVVALPLPQLGGKCDLYTRRRVGESRTTPKLRELLKQHGAS